jgi:hypothetical protein
MFIHCVWTFYRQYQHRGLGAMMIQACLEDAVIAGMHGVAVVAREQAWLAGPSLFLANGFELVDTVPPDYQLLVRKLSPSAANPAFKAGWEDRPKKYSRGLTIVRSHQCPHIAKFAGEIAQAAERDYKIKPRIVEIRSHREAQNAPTPLRRVCSAPRRPDSGRPSDQPHALPKHHENCNSAIDSSS